MADVALCPSFRTFIDDLPRPAPPPPHADSGIDFVFDYDFDLDLDLDIDLDFEFSRPPAGNPLSPDYPIFGRPPSSVSDADVPSADVYCPWSPQISSMRKSRSTGSASTSACAWRLRDLVFGRSKSNREPTRKKTSKVDSAVPAYGSELGKKERRRFSEAYRKEAVVFLPSLKAIRRGFLSF